MSEAFDSHIASDFNAQAIIPYDIWNETRGLREYYLPF